MGKALFTYFMLLLGSLPLPAQVNLVPNPSFEEYWECPDGDGEFYKLDSWYAFGSAEGFNPCCVGTCLFGVPQNAGGYQFAFDGKGYSGFYYWLDSGDGYASKEYISTKLQVKLEQGTKYCLSFWVSLADSSQYSIDRIGAYFSAQQLLNVNFSENIPPFIPQIQTQEYTFFGDYTGWTQVSGEFCAEGQEQYMTIGNFNKNSQTNHLIKPGPYSTQLNGAYYYVDMVSLTKCGSCGNTQYDIPNIFTPNGDGMNDSIDFVSGADADHRLTIYNRWGAVVLDKKGKNISWDGRNHGHQKLSDGVYFYIITGPNPSKSGVIHLIGN